MLHNTPSLERLIRVLQKVPYLASKNMYRVVSHFLDLDNDQLDYVCSVLRSAKKNISHCDICFYWQEIGHPCSYCSSDKRDSVTVCVVESWQDLLAIEKTEGYGGLYHILGGIICPLDGVGPDDLSIDALVSRVRKYGIKEVIFAFNQTPEGEATAAFIKRKLQEYPVKMSSLARGVPVGSLLETMDRVTVYKAISERRPF